MGEGIKKSMLVVSGAVVGAAGSLYALTNKSAETADRIDKMSQKIGISKEAFQEWDYVCSQSGVDVGVLQNGVKTLVTQMDAAKNGSENAQGAFDALGVSWTDGTGKLKTQEQMLEETMVALAGMEDGSERARLATELFGRAGTELAPILNSGSDGITDLKDRCHELGLVMSDEAVSAGVVLGDTIADVKASFGAIGRELGEKLMPIAQQIADYLIEKMPVIQEKVNTVVEAVKNAVEFAVTHQGLLAAIATAIGVVVGAITLYNAVAAVKAAMDAAEVASLGALISAQLACAAATLAAIAPYVAIVAAIAAVIAIIVVCVKHWDEIKAKVIEVWESIKQKTVEAVENVKEKFEAMKQAISDKVSAIKQWVVDKFNAIKEGMSNAVSNAKQAVVNTFQNIKEGITQKVNAVKETVTNTFNKVKEAITHPVETAKELVRTAIEKIKSFFHFEWSLPKLKMPHISISGEFNLMPPKVPKFSIDWYANGGVFDKPTLFPYGSGSVGGLGEAGAEAVVPLEKNTQWLDRIAERLHGGSTPIYLTIDGKVLGEVTVDSINALTQQRGSIPLKLV